MSESPEIPSLKTMKWRVSALGLSGDYRVTPQEIAADALTLAAEVERLQTELNQAHIDRHQLSVQVREFRVKCDPREDVVLCTAAELNAFAYCKMVDFGG